MSNPYWDSEKVNVCNCGATTLKWQPVFYGDEPVKLDITFDNRDECDLWIEEYLVPHPTPKLDATVREHKMPETTDERLEALTTLVRLYMDKTDKHLEWHDIHQGFVHDHLHYETDNCTPGGVIRSQGPS